jgi:hypothetical protein
MANRLIYATELFIMGHEYGHILSGHFSDRSSKVHSALPGDDVNEFGTSWQQEFQADNRGAELMSAALQIREYPFQMSFVGADFFFICAMLVERGLSILNTGIDTVPDGNDTSTTHPPAGLRLAALHLGLETALPKQVYANVRIVSDMLLGVVEMLWTVAAAPSLHSLHQKRARPSNAWIELAQRHGGTP